MKTTGIVRKVDPLGRIVLPVALRRGLNIDLKDPMELYVDNEKIILKKYTPNMECMITGEVTEDNIAYSNGDIVLSPNGTKLLIKSLEKELNQL